MKENESAMEKGTTSPATEQGSIHDNGTNEPTDNCKQEEKYLDGTLLAKMMRGGAAQLRSNATEVNNLNVFPVPDGDTGDNMSMTIEGGVAALEGADTSSLSEAMRQVSQGMLLNARGNSGVILSQFFAGIAHGFAEYEKADAAAVGAALREGVKQAYASVITPTEGTILTVAREAVEYAVARIDAHSTLRTLFADLITEMYASLQRTPQLLDVLKEAGVIDSGGAGLFYIMQGFNNILLGEQTDTISSATPTPPKATQIDLSRFGPDSEMVYAYCTEALLQLQNQKTDIETFDVHTIISYLQTIGDSIVAFQTGSIVKLHVHTLTPEKALAFCRQYGEFLTIKIENMNVQHTEKAEGNDSDVRKAAETSSSSAFTPNTATHQRFARTDTKEFGVVAVASGEGIAALFRELGADQVIDGGQTNNPSAQDFLRAFDQTGAHHIFVFPNNSNIILAAKQAAQMYDRADIHVIESKDLGQGYAAISSMNFESGDPDAIAKSLNEAMQHVTTGCISQAIRDAELSGIQIKKGDTIGFVGKQMLVSCPVRMDAVCTLLLKMEEQIGEMYLITAFLGKDVTQEEQNALQNYVKTQFPDVELYTVHGGQDVYPFIFVAE